MIKLMAYNALCVTFSALIMNISIASLSTLHTDALKCIFIHLDPESYEKMILNKIDGDILLISLHEQRTAENPLCFLSAKNTHFRFLIYVNKYFNTAVTTFFNNNQQSILSKKLLYEDPIRNFIERQEIQFFNLPGTINNIPINVIAALKHKNISSCKEYEFVISMNPVNCSAVTTLPRFNTTNHIENISLMLFACIKNKESEENNVCVQTLVEDIKLLLEKLSQNYSSCKTFITTSINGNGFVGNVVKLRISRYQDDVTNYWNVFPIQLFCKCIDFKKKFESNN